jgi:tetratricopeptide (TPR) repeat protein
MRRQKAGAVGFACNWETAMPTCLELYDEAVRLKDEGKLDEAIDAMKKAVAQDDSFALGHFGLAKYYSVAGRHDQAIDHGRRAVELDPDDYMSWIALSVNYRDAGMVPEAEHAMARAQQVQMGGR